MKNRDQFRFARNACAAAVLSVAMGLAWAADPFELKDIRIEGLQRVEPGTIFASLPFRVGDNYTNEKGAVAIRNIFGLGLFKDVRLDVQGDTLVVIVAERPNIATVDFVGVKEFDKDNLRKALRDVGLTDGRPYDQALVDRAEQELKRQYIGRSLYGAHVVTTVTPVARNRVGITFTVNEGGTAKIRDIHIVGNKDFSEKTLKNLFESDTGGWLSWYTKSDRYSQAKVNADIEALRSFYLNQGYLEFKIVSTQVALTPDKQGVGITLNIDEGKRFIVSDVKLDGNFLEKEEEFKTFVTIKPGQAYKAEDIASTDSMRFSTSVLTWQAAVEGLGIAIGQTSLLADDLKAQRLVRPFNLPVRTGASYYLVRPQLQRHTRKVMLFRDWILEQTASAREGQSLTQAMR